MLNRADMLDEKAICILIYGILPWRFFSSASSDRFLLQNCWNCSLGHILNHRYFIFMESLHHSVVLSAKTAMTLFFALSSSIHIKLKDTLFCKKNLVFMDVYVCVFYVVTIYYSTFCIIEFWFCVKYETSSIDNTLNFWDILFLKRI